MDELIIIEGHSEVVMPATSTKSLFKYFPSFESSEYSRQNIEKLVSELQVRTTCAEEVNDPSDWNPSFVEDLGVRGLREYFKLVREDAKQKISQGELSPAIFNELPTESEIKKMRRVPKLWANRLKDSILSAFNNYGFVCYTAQPDNALMWAHYGSSHSGVCFEFTTEPTLKTNLVSDLPLVSFAVQMKYSLERPKIAASKNLPKTNPDDLYKVIITKSKDWEYEQEWRVIGKYKLFPLLAPKK